MSYRPTPQEAIDKGPATSDIRITTKSRFERLTGIPETPPTVPEVVDKLEALGSSRQIADYLHEQGTTGARGIFHACPVANFISERTGATVSVTSNLIIWTTTPRTQTNTIEINDGPLHDFVQEFDFNCYPDLIEKGQR